MSDKPGNNYNLEDAYKALELDDLDKLMPEWLVWLEEWQREEEEWRRKMDEEWHSSMDSFMDELERQHKEAIRKFEELLGEKGASDGCTKRSKRTQTQR